MTGPMSVQYLEELPVEVLFLIFQYLDLPSLAALASTCHFLYNLINDEYLHIKSFSLLVTNQFSVEVQKKSLQLLSSINKFKTNYYWRKKRYEEKLYLVSKEKFRPWLRLSENGLYVGRGREIALYERFRDGISNAPVAIFNGHNDDITRFVVDGDVLISSANDGELCCWDAKSGSLKFHAVNDVKWNESVYIDCQSRILASGFHKASLVKFWLLNDVEFIFRNQVEQTERVWSVALNDNASSCSIGSAGYTSAPLKIYDLNKGMYSLAISEKYKTGAGVFDAVWESSQILISGGFDTYIRMWDLRMGECVQSWSDPYDAAIYSLATDNMWTILAGTAVNGRITLWDKRSPKCIQMYFTSLNSDGGPVYSLDFDPHHLFAALDSSLHMLNFR